MHLVLLASVTFPSVGELCHFVRPPAMSENARFFGGAGRGSYRQIWDAQMHPSSNGKMRQREGWQADACTCVCLQDVFCSRLGRMGGSEKVGIMQPSSSMHKSSLERRPRKIPSPKSSHLLSPLGGKGWEGEATFSLRRKP